MFVCLYDSNTFLHGAEPPVIPLTYGIKGITGDRVPCAVGSHANLSAVGQGDYGGQSPLCRRLSLNP